MKSTMKLNFWGVGLALATLGAAENARPREPRTPDLARARQAFETGITAHLDQTVPADCRPWLYASPEDMRWWETARFGQFVHWNPSCLVETEISWGRNGPREPDGEPAHSGVPLEVYDNLYRRFNPTRFNAEEWIRMVKASGAKYFIFTTKHHDGFCMFDAPNTDYKITNTPFGRDVCREIADACHKYGIKLFWYYSQPDWHNPDYRDKRKERYRRYVYEHLWKLLTDYGKVDGVWFDCLGSRWTDWNTPYLVKMIRLLQPGIIINRRWGWGMPGIKNPGDFDTPEQKVGEFQIDRPWETCATMGAGWSWRGADQPVKSLAECLHLLIHCAIGGGNLALDWGPRPDGTIWPPMKENYLNMGKWLARYGESIQATRGGPYKPAPWGGATRRGNTIYLHILCRFPAGVPAEIHLPPLPPEMKIRNCRALTGGRASCRQTPEGITVTFADRSPVDNIIALELDRPAAEIAPIECPVKSVLPAKKTCAASSSFGAAFTPDHIYTTTRDKHGKPRAGFWAPRNDDASPWLTVAFSRPVTFNCVTLSQTIGGAKVKRFEIQYDQNGRWKTLYAGAQLDARLAVQCRPVTTTKLRLQLHERNLPTGLHISEFDVKWVGAPAADGGAARKMPDAERARQIADLKFGMFICWSFSTFGGKEWTTEPHGPEFFRATGCDTDQWARTAREAGMGYILFLAKHHDGFCLWDTRTTSHKVTRSPLGIDVLARLRQSCDRHGIKLALYFSEGDWTWPGRKGNRSGANPEMKKAQLRELCTQYGPIEFFWMDHAVGDGGLSHRDTVAWVHRFQPNCFVGFNSGQPAGRLALRERGRPGPIGGENLRWTGKDMEHAGHRYFLAEFTYPILPKHQGGAQWFYSLPQHDHLCLPAEKIYRDYLGAVKYGNLFSLDVGPNYAGRLRDIDVQTLRRVGRYIRGELTLP
jgi:alpha-L-fucosidase